VTPYITGRPGQERWYLAIRAKYSAVASGHYALVGVSDDVHDVALGMYGTLDTGNIVAFLSSSGGREIQVLCARDGNYHELELWSDGAGTFYARADGGAVKTLSGGDAGWAPGGFLLAQAYAAVGGNNHGVQIDDLLFIVGKAT
jgi:hypothetical protein